LNLAPFLPNKILCMYWFDFQNTIPVNHTVDFR